MCLTKRANPSLTIPKAIRVKNLWPAMLRTIYGDPDRYVNQYWSKYPGKYLTGDLAKRDKDGYFWIIGRVDDVIKVSGHRLGTRRLNRRW